MLKSLVQFYMPINSLFYVSGMKQITYILVLAIGGVVFVVGSGLLVAHWRLLHKLKPKIPAWTAWFALIGIASLLVFFGYKKLKRK